MTYTITAAKYANADNTSAIIETTEAGSVAVSPTDTPDLWAAMLNFGTPAAYSISASDLENLINQEFERRVQEVLPNTTRNRLIAKDANGKLTGADKLTVKSIDDWVDDMVADRDALILAGDTTYDNDGHWTTPSAAIVTFIAQY